jgi:hypothetical protein
VIAAARRFAPLLVLALGTLAILGCAAFGDDENDDDAAISAAQAKALLLQPADLPRVFTRFDHGELTFTDFQAGPREDPARFERQGGWKARYRRPGSTSTRGPLLVVSMIDVFSDADHAARDLEAYEMVFSERGRPRPAAVGEQALARITGVGTVRYFDVAWRQANVTASLSVQGFRGRISLADVVELARKQERRIERALRRSR